ncbi:hypothetical protein REPUB_Repub08aG0077400 [Reevesia pubescens]
MDFTVDDARGVLIPQGLEIEGNINVTLNNKEKDRIRSRWAKTLIIKGTTTFSLNSSQMWIKKRSLKVDLVWLRLSELPIEYYDLEILKKIGRHIGPLLRVESHTLTWERGKYARLCVQLNLDKPLPKSVIVEG